ncbi:MAG: GNAT family N-acetyltransferase [Candidatus Staskawiczbacteria bacterium]
MKNDNLNIVIGEPKIGEERDLVYILKETWLATYPNVEHGITKEDILSKDFDSYKKISAWRSSIKNNGKSSKHLFVARDNNKVVGVCVVSKKGKFNEVNVLYILPEYQGMGIGERLFERSVNWLGNRKNIFIKVVSYNIGAISFYEKYGFVKTGVIDETRTVNGKVMPEIQLELQPKK